MIMIYSTCCISKGIWYTFVLDENVTVHFHSDKPTHANTYSASNTVCL